MRVIRKNPPVFPFCGKEFSRRPLRRLPSVFVLSAAAIILVIPTTAGNTIKPQRIPSFLSLKIYLKTGAEASFWRVHLNEFVTSGNFKISFNFKIRCNSDDLTLRRG